MPKRKRGATTTIRVPDAWAGRLNTEMVRAWLGDYLQCPGPLPVDPGGGEARVSFSLPKRAVKVLAAGLGETESAALRRLIASRVASPRLLPSTKPLPSLPAPRSLASEPQDGAIEQYRESITLAPGDYRTVAVSDARSCSADGGYDSASLTWPHLGTWPGGEPGAVLSWALGIRAGENPVMIPEPYRAPAVRLARQLPVTETRSPSSIVCWLQSAPNRPTQTRQTHLPLQRRDSAAKGWLESIPLWILLALPFLVILAVPLILRFLQKLLGEVPAVSAGSIVSLPEPSFKPWIPIPPGG